MEASLVCVISKVEDLVKRHVSGAGGGTFNWLSEIAPLVINLQVMLPSDRSFPLLTPPPRQMLPSDWSFPLLTPPSC